MEMLNKIFLTSQIAKIDRYTVDHEPITSLELMERAATVWTDYFLAVLEGEIKSVVVVVGAGNNGGDGYVIARLLTLREIPVEVWQVAGNSRSTDCEENYRRYRHLASVKEICCVDDFVLPQGAIVVDAILGSGLNRKVTGLMAEVIRKINAAENKVVAVDIPSGLAGEDNAWNDPEAIVCADYTFTFQFPKLSFFLPENARYVGKWSVLDIGLHPEAIRQQPTSWYYTTQETVRELLPVAPVFAHKGLNGKGLLIAGSYGMLGASLLAAKAAVRSGIGLLYCHLPKRGGDLMQMTVPEAILDLDRSALCFTGIERWKDYDAIAVGPALGKEPETVRALESLLRCWKGRLILDADALNLLAEHRELLELLPAGTILTPHLKEFERLAGKSENDFERLNKLSIFANQYQVYLVLKGAYSVVATPDRRLFFNMSGNPGMAKGGSGDVLTGVLLALAANGLEPLDVLRIGVYAHGLAGDCAVEENGQRGCSAGMIAEQMGKAWKKLEKQ